MSFWREDALELQEEEPQPGWSGLYDPWNGRRREETPFDLFPDSELYYNTEESDYEDEDHTPDQHEEEQVVDDDGDEHEVFLRSPSPLRSPPPLNMFLYTIYEEDEEGLMRIPVQNQGIRRRIDEEDTDEAPPCRRQRVEETQEPHLNLTQDYCNLSLFEPDIVFKTSYSPPYSHHLIVTTSSSS